MEDNRDNLLSRQNIDTPHTSIPEQNKSTTPIIETEKRSFNATEHEKHLCDLTIEMIYSDQVKSFLEQFHTDDIQKLKRIINREMISYSPAGSVADLIHHTILKKPIDEKGVNNLEPEEIRLEFLRFYKEFMITIDNRIPARTVLGIDEETPLDLELITNRTVELHKAQYVKGKGQPQDFVRKLIDRAF